MTSDDPSAGAAPQQSDYDERYFQIGLGLPYDESVSHWAHFFGVIADDIVSQLEPRTVLDTGCAKGFLVAALLERGVDAAGVDISEYAVEAAVTGAKGHIRVHNLTDPLEGRWDLVTCIEVLEHMAPPDTQRAIDNICAVTDQIMLSSTPHDFVEPSHVNVHPVATWARWFAARGFFRRTDLDLSFVSPWCVVFERRKMSPADVTYLYEVEAAPLREEAVIKRAELLGAERRIGDLTAELAAIRQTDGEYDPSFQDAEPRYDIERVVALIDEVIGLRSEMAEQDYRHDLALRSLRSASDARHTDLEAQVADADRRVADADRRVADAESRAADADRRVAELIASRSWRIGQALLRPARQLRRLLR